MKIFLIIIAGMIANIVGLTGPLHEIWHVMASWFYGYFPLSGWTWTELVPENNFLPVIYAGIFGETILLTVIIQVAFWKKKIKTGYFFLGNLASLGLIAIFSGTGMFLLDMEAAYNIASASSVQTVYNVWRFLLVIVLLISIRHAMWTKRENNRVFRGKVAINRGKRV